MRALGEFTAGAERDGDPGVDGGWRVLFGDVRVEGAALRSMFLFEGLRMKLRYYEDIAYRCGKGKFTYAPGEGLHPLELAARDIFGVRAASDGEASAKGGRGSKGSREVVKR